MNDVGLFWLLLPVASASGWYLARRSNEKLSGRRVKELSTTYFRGLNYLLNEQPDKAIEEFIKVAEVNSETIETHLALGNLFRRRGEVDRAIRIHQNLIARPTLNSEQRTHALLELGEDYMRAGLLDRAENLFTELIDIKAHTPSALKHLLQIFQQEKDWEQAITTARRLLSMGDETMSAVIAQYYCEITELACKDGDIVTALNAIKLARKEDKSCSRASMLEAEILQRNNRESEAIDAYKRVVEQNINHIPIILDALLSCYRSLKQEEQASAYLEEIIQRYDGISPILAYAESLREKYDDKHALDYITDQLRKRSSVRGLDYLIGLTLNNSDGEAHANLLILRDVTQKLLAGRSIYRCSNCGFSGRTLHWQCPGCKTWNTTKPVHGLTGE